MRCFWILLLLCGNIAHAGPSYYAPQGHAVGGKSASVVANLSNLGLTIPTDFVGYSINTSAVINGLLPGAGSLCSLAGLLGTSGVLRIGGSDSDTLVSAPPLTQPIANNLEAFRACLGNGWTLIYGLDSVINNSTVAATQAGLINTASGTKAVFQFGNEPVVTGNFTIATYQTMWNSYQSAVIGAIPSAKLAAWDDYNYGSTQTVIGGLTGRVVGLTYITQHFYGGNCSLLIPASQLIGTVVYNVSSGLAIFGNNTWAAANGVKLRMSETNTICGGGVLGASNLMMSSAWFLNEAILLANAGWGGVNIHNNLWWPVSGGAKVILTANPNTYGALLAESNGNYIPGAIFYGMFLFSKIEGQQTATVAVNGDANVLAIATKGGNGNSNILVVNNDALEPVKIIPDQSTNWSTANVLQVKGSAGCNEPSPTVGGASIGESGSWSGVPFLINKGQSIILDPCGAALIQIQP